MRSTLSPLTTTEAWQYELKTVVTDFAELCRLLQLDPASLDIDAHVLKTFALRVPLNFISRMQKSNPFDPLLLQVLPQAVEALAHTDYQRDPVGDTQHNPLPGLIHKYHGRVLFTLAGGCAVNCRYCFRRHFPYQENMTDSQQRQHIIDYLQADETIQEVIFSGGDPLVLKDNELSRWISLLEMVPHLTRLRIHTRFPIMIPSRLTKSLLRLLQDTRLQVSMVIHCNHPQELSHEVMQALHFYQQNGIILLNQSVLLKHINDDAEVLVKLHNQLFAAGVLPYYLHMLDKVAGASHFAVPDSKAHALMQVLQQRLPGYLVPRLVREIAGLPHKKIITLS